MLATSHSPWWMKKRPKSKTGNSENQRYRLWSIDSDYMWMCCWSEYSPIQDIAQTEIAPPKRWHDRHKTRKGPQWSQYIPKIPNISLLWWIGQKQPASTQHKKSNKIQKLSRQQKKSETQSLSNVYPTLFDKKKKTLPRYRWPPSSFCSQNLPASSVKRNFGCVVWLFDLGALMVYRDGSRFGVSLCPTSVVHTMAAQKKHQPIWAVFNISCLGCFHFNLVSPLSFYRVWVSLHQTHVPWPKVLS